MAEALRLGRVKYDWKGGQFTQTLRKSAKRGIRAVCARFQKLCQKAVSVSANNDGSGNTATTASAAWIIAQRRAQRFFEGDMANISNKVIREFMPVPRKYDHSNPGSPPRLITGKGRQSIFSAFDDTGLVGRVGTISEYMAHLELGVKGGKKIYPKRKMCLVFPGYDEFGNWTWLYRKKVIQGKIKPRPWLKPTLLDNQSLLAQVFQKEAGTEIATGGKLTFGK